MKRLLLIPLATVVSVVALVSTPYQAGAMVTPSNEKSRVTAARCTVAKGRITHMTDMMKNVSDRRTTTYTNIRERAVARVAVLKQKGYDTSKLTTDLQTIDAQIKDYHAKANMLYSDLTTAQDTACGDGEGAFVSALATARTQLKAVRQASETVHQTFRTVIVPDIKAAATWLKNN